MKNKKSPRRGEKPVTINPDGSFSVIGELADQIVASAAALGMDVNAYVEKSIGEFLSAMKP